MHHISDLKLISEKFVKYHSGTNRISLLENIRPFTEIKSTYTIVLFKQATIKVFFTRARQMGLPERSFNQLKEEGVATPKDLKEFTKDGLEAVFYNFCKPAKSDVV